MVNYLNLLRLLGFEIGAVSKTSDDSIFVRIKNSDCFADFYDSGEVVLSYRDYDTRYYGDFVVGDFDGIQKFIKDNFR